MRFIIKILGFIFDLLHPAISWSAGIDFAESSRSILVVEVSHSDTYTPDFTLSNSRFKIVETYNLTMRREAWLWIRSAEDDITDAQEFLSRKRYFRTAFFAQQAVEKILKALFIIAAREEPPKINTVTELYKELKEKSDFSLPGEIEKQLYFLNKFYTVSRYPDAANGLPSESVDEIEAERALKLAMEVMEHAKRFAEKD